MVFYGKNLTSFPNLKAFPKKRKLQISQGGVLREEQVTVDNALVKHEIVTEMRVKEYLYK